jgi:hypothetical protein
VPFLNIDEKLPPRILISKVVGPVAPFHEAHRINPRKFRYVHPLQVFDEFFGVVGRK